MLPLAWATGPTDTSGPLPRKEYRGIDYHTVVVSGERACFFAFYFGAPERTGPKFELGVNYFLDPIKFGKGSNETYNCWPKEALPPAKKGGLRPPPPPDTGMVWLQSYQMLLVWNEGQYRWKESGRVSLAHLPPNAGGGGGGSEKAASSSSVKWKSLPPGWELSLNRQNSQMKVNWTVSIDSFIVCPKEEKQVDNEDNGGKGGGGRGGGGNGVSPGGDSTFFSKFLIFSVLVVVLVFAILFFGYRLLQERSPAVAAAAGGNKKFKIKVC